MRGRKPEATPLKILKGAQPCRVNGDEPSPARSRPVMPDRLSGEAASEWDRICELLDGMGALNETQGPLIAIYCGAYHRLLMAEESLEAHGPMIETTRQINPVMTETVVKANPAAAIAARCEAQMARCLNDLGLTPASLSKLKTSKAPAESKLAQQMAARRKL
jgi:P27 family predicted phage terminase small subunit